MKYKRALISSVMLTFLLQTGLVFAGSQEAARCKELGKKGFSSAIAVCSTQIAENPDDIESVFWRGIAYAKLAIGINQHNIDALEDFKRVLAVRPDDVQALENRAEIYHRISYYKEALEDATKAIQLDGGSVAAHLVVARTHLSLQNYEVAVSGFTRVLQMNPENSYTRAVVLQNRAFAFKQLGKYDLSLADRNTLIDLDPRNYYCYESRAEVLTLMGRKQAAIADYRTAIGLIENDSKKAQDAFYLKERDNFLRKIGDLSK